MKHFFTLSALLIPLASFAQLEHEEVSIQVVEPHDTTNKVYNILHQNAPHLYNIPDVPRFALLGKESKYYMGLGVNIKAVGVFDFGSPISNPYEFIPASIPVSSAPGNGAQFKFSGQQSNIYLNAVALPGTPNQLGAYVSINFVNPNYAPSLNHAYLKYRDFTAGYTFSIFSDAAATPVTIDYQGMNAFTGMIHGMVAYEKTFGKKKGWTAGVGLDMPANSYTLTDKTASVNQRVPDIPFYIQKNWANGNGWLRASAIVRNLYYRNLAAGRNVDKIGWGVKMSGSTPVTSRLTAYWQGVYGKGVASYIQDLGATGMDLMPDPSDPARLDPVKVWGAYGALQYNFSKNVFGTLGYSQVRTYAHQYPVADGSNPWKNGYKYAQYVVANVIWNVNSIVQVGAEYLYGRRVDYGDTQAHDNRLEAMLQVSF